MCQKRIAIQAKWQMARRNGPSCHREKASYTIKNLTADFALARLQKHANTGVGIKQMRHGTGLYRFHGRKLPLIRPRKGRVSDMNGIEKAIWPVFWFQRLQNNGIPFMPNAHGGRGDVIAFRQTHSLALAFADDGCSFHILLGKAALTEFNLAHFPPPRKDEEKFQRQIQRTREKAFPSVFIRGLSFFVPVEFLFSASSAPLRGLRKSACWVATVATS
jgi:hypothetical protein